ncbi:uncharacterized protein BDR25DRAFT_363235 [Lindgomyces ingoldianus]|uniref:Uncharacterized protein n=1 Tax=Lindgomyces ingoldianus TaxID=673940 RepID=A0ACB6QA84_9PLEO|nr:uncharacterized protein BDR25DRAFT_363235 [Lindgomyces ingoldianus]KAF2463027.1 hypothetical protein BDR25DRAFT_363235 [Lindgomyces ingoldianus]
MFVYLPKETNKVSSQPCASFPEPPKLTCTGFAVLQTLHQPTKMNKQLEHHYFKPLCKVGSGNIRQMLRRVGLTVDHDDQEVRSRHRSNPFLYIIKSSASLLSFVCCIFPTYPDICINFHHAHYFPSITTPTPKILPLYSISHLRQSEAQKTASPTYTPLPHSL